MSAGVWQEQGQAKITLAAKIPRESAHDYAPFAFLVTLDRAATSYSRFARGLYSDNDRKILGYEFRLLKIK